jgi:hypothetical protein
MIFVKRTACPASLDPDDPASTGSLELEACKKHWKESGTPPPADSFKAYKGKDVRAALNAMFNAKCAYCESQISASTDTNIEHYRPKGGISDWDGHPGYWWLAMKWENLVLSCMHCNQGRRQLIFDPDMTEDEIREAIERNDLLTTGKRNAFPTRQGKWTSDQDGDVNTEDPLLLDPSSTDPEPLFDWVLGTTVTTIKPRAADSRAETTKELLGLNRRYLTEARAKVFLSLQLIELHIDAYMKVIGSAESDILAAFAKTVIENELEKINVHCDAGQPYAGLARYFRSRIQEKVAKTLAG